MAGGGGLGLSVNELLTFRLPCCPSAEIVAVTTMVLLLVMVKLKSCGLAVMFDEPLTVTLSTTPVQLLLTHWAVNVIDCIWCKSLAVTVASNGTPTVTGEGIVMPLTFCDQEEGMRNKPAAIAASLRGPRMFLARIEVVIDLNGPSTSRAA